MYTIELLIQDDLDDASQPDCLLEVGTVIAVSDESGATVQGRIVTVRIRSEEG